MAGLQFTDGVADVAGATTALFVPGDRPERFEKAAHSGADVVIIDLEDAVATPEKANALREVVRALSPAGGTAALRALVRINSMASANAAPEIAALLDLAAETGHGLLGVVVPKAAEPVEIGRLRRDLPDSLALVPLIESASGITRALEIASVPGVTRLAFGAVDFALDVDASGSDELLNYARSQLIVASRAAGIAAPLDSPFTDIADAQGAARSAQLARRFGFGGKLCIHPTQISAVNEAFTPSAEEIGWARAVIDAGEGAVQVGGQMVDEAVAEAARRTLLRAERKLISPS